MNLVLAVFISLVFVPFSQGQQAYSFSVNRYAQRDLECKGASDEVLKRFTQATDVKILGTNCKVAPAGRGLDITIRYAAEADLPVVSNGAWPLTRSVGACQTKLKEEEAFFTKTTGLTPFLSYCAYHSEKSSWEKSFIHLFTPVMHAMGKPNALIRTLALPMHQGGFFAGNATEREILDKSVMLGLPIVDARIDAPLDTKTYDSDLWLRFAVSPEKAGHNFTNDYLLSDRLELFSSAQANERRAIEVTDVGHPKMPPALSEHARGERAKIGGDDEQDSVWRQRFDGELE